MPGSFVSFPISGLARCFQWTVPANSMPMQVPGTYLLSMDAREYVALFEGKHVQLMWNITTSQPTLWKITPAHSKARFFL
jgi:hypothetical protein